LKKEQQNIPGGVGFALMDLASKFGESSGERKSLLEFASQLVEANLKYLEHWDFKRDKQIQGGFLLGAPGVHVNHFFPLPHPALLPKILSRPPPCSPG
jgi:hypothetical protein